MVVISFRGVPPLSEGDLRGLEEMLSDRDVFTTTFQDLGPIRYRAETYLRELDVFETTAYMQMDRNLVSHLVGLVLDGDVVIGAEQRCAAAILAFAQYAEMCLEPNLALYEAAASCHEPLSTSELNVLWRMENTHPQVYADLALGRRGAIREEELASPPPHEKANEDLSRELNVWRYVYTGLLKLATLARARGSGAEKFESFIGWMERDFLFSAAYLLLANRYLPEGASGRRTMLKWQGAADRTKALRGVRNAAWDLAHVLEWSRKAKRQAEASQLWILASLDRGLHRVARAILCSGFSDDEAERVLVVEFETAWGPKDGPRLLKIYRESIDRCGAADPTNERRQVSMERSRELIRTLEEEVLCPLTGR